MLHTARCELLAVGWRIRRVVQLDTAHPEQERQRRLPVQTREDPISLEAAQGVVLSEAAPLDTEVVTLKNASGRVLANQIRSSHDEPSIPQAAMDGYALRSADVKTASSQKGIRLSVIGKVSAGQKRGLKVKQGEAVHIMTGGSLPGGADAVVPQEFAEVVKEGIRVIRPVKAGDYLVPVGAEFQRDQHILPSGTVLRTRELTMLAALGHTRVHVRRQPVVAVLATGSELVEVGERLEPGQTFASNLHTVAHLANRCGGKANYLGVAGDSLNVLARKFQRGTKDDVIVTTGGTGKGEKDLVPDAIAKLGGDFLFRGVAMIPGKQTLVAEMGDTLLFGLPGRPAATYIAFEQLVRPVILRMLGVSQVYMPEMTATLSHPVKLKGRIQSFLFCRLFFGPSGPQVESLRSEAKGMLTEMLAANGLLRLPPGREYLEAGEAVRVQLLDLGLEGLSYFEQP